MDGSRKKQGVHREGGIPGRKNRGGIALGVTGAWGLQELGEGQQPGRQEPRGAGLGLSTKECQGGV